MCHTSSKLQLTILAKQCLKSNKSHAIFFTVRREKIETSDRNVLGQEEEAAAEETSMGHVTEPSIFFFFLVHFG